jgi:sigma-B regulation protein RsbU (phosphoserine phosphatase)
MADSQNLRWSAAEKATLLGVRQLRHALIAELTNRGIDATLAEQFALALTEIGNNVAIHSAGPTLLVASLDVSFIGITLEIADDGFPWMNRSVNLADAARAFPDTLSENGRGLALVVAAFPESLYLPFGTDGLNRLIIRHRFAGTTGLPIALMVDDDPAVGLLLRSYLVAEYDVILAASVEAAELELKMVKPELIISDLHMPGADGFTFRRRLLSNPEHGLIPFLYLTSDNSPATIAAAIDAGVDEILHKPITARHLRDVLRRLLQRRRQLLSLQSSVAMAGVKRPVAAPPSRFAGYEIAIRSHAAGNGHGPSTTTGDLICHQHTVDHLRLVVADAMGHGLGAHLISMSILGFIRGAVAGLADDLPPDRFLTHMAGLLTDEGLLSGATFTALACWISTEGRIRMVNAGQPYPVLIKGGQVETIELSGGLLGLGHDTAGDVLELSLEEGDRLILFSDGLVDLADSDDESMRSSPVTRAIERLSGGSADQIADGIVSEYFSSFGSQLRDDLLVCVIGRGGARRDAGEFGQ